MTEEEQNLPANEKIIRLTAYIGKVVETINTEVAAQKEMEQLVAQHAKEPKAQENAIKNLNIKNSEIEDLLIEKNNLTTQLQNLTEQSPESSTQNSPAQERNAATTKKKSRNKATVLPPGPPVDEAPLPPEEEHVAKASALYSYQATNKSELSFQQDDILLITEQDESGWWFANLNGKCGFVPSNYMSVITE